jgi:hypothetical protein
MLRDSMKLIYLLAAPLVGARVIQSHQQIPVLGNDIVQNEAKATVHNEAVPVVGVHFTSSYAVAAARYQDGTVRDLGKVLGNAEYIELMSRWTDWDRNPHANPQAWWVRNVYNQDLANIHTKPSLSVLFHRSRSREATLPMPCTRPAAQRP